MDVTSTSAQATASTTTAKKSTTSSTVDSNTFIQLLIAQAKNQDPTNPTDPSQYVQQYAMMSQVEQSVATNAKLDEVIAGINALKPVASQTDAS